MIYKNKVCAIILARGGSKSIPNKNIKPISNSNCLSLTIRSLLNVLNLDQIIVSSDSDEILEIARKQKVLTLKRPSHLSTDEASSEDAWLHAINYLRKISKLPEIIIAPQVTSPLRYKNTFKDALRLFEKENLDSLFSATEISSHSFEWMLSEKEISPVNYDPYKNRKRRQDHHQKKRIKENGSFFIFKTEGFLNSKNRMFGEIGYFLQDKLESIEIDEINDWVIAESVLNFKKELFIY